MSHQIIKSVVASVSLLMLAGYSHAQTATPQPTPMTPQSSDVEAGGAPERRTEDTSESSTPGPHAGGSNEEVNKRQGAPHPLGGSKTTQTPRPGPDSANPPAHTGTIHGATTPSHDAGKLSETDKKERSVGTKKDRGG